MSMLAGLTTDESIQDEKDSLGSSGPLDSNVYDLTIKYAFMTKSKGGALALNLHLNEASGALLRQQLWVTSGDAKGNKNYYERNGKRHYLPGFNIANAVSLLSVGKEISKLDTEEKTIKLYNFDSKSEEPTVVDMVMDLVGKEITCGVLKQVVDKNVKDPATGEYVPSGETRTENEIDKVFRTRDKLTVAEIRRKLTEPVFYEEWTAKWKGKEKDKSTGTKTSGTTGAPQAAGKAAPVDDLFA